MMPGIPRTAALRSGTTEKCVANRYLSVAGFKLDFRLKSTFRLSFVMLVGLHAILVIFIIIIIYYA